MSSLFPLAPPPALPTCVLYRIRQHLRDAVAPSEPWVNVASEWYARAVADGLLPLPPALVRRAVHVVELHLRRNGILPPGGRLTAMRRCGGCGGECPPYYLAAGVCEDCRCGADAPAD